MIQSGETVQSPYPPHSRSAAMAFVKELPSPEDRERYGSLLRLHEGRIWIADHERQIFLSGGQDGNPYYDDLIEAIFRIVFKGVAFKFYVYCHEWRLPKVDDVFVLKWDSINAIDPTPSTVEVDQAELIVAIKSAIEILGSDALSSGSWGPTKVLFGF